MRAKSIVKIWGKILTKGAKLFFRFLPTRPYRAHLKGHCVRDENRNRVNSRFNGRRSVEHGPNNVIDIANAVDRTLEIVRTKKSVYIFRLFVDGWLQRICKWWRKHRKRSSICWARTVSSGKRRYQDLPLALSGSGMQRNYSHLWMERVFNRAQSAVE